MIQGNITFVTGFCNWKDTRTLLHIKQLLISPSTYQVHPGMWEKCYLRHAKQKAPSRHYLLKVAQNIQFLSRQGIALRGDGPETDSNFMQLMHLCALDDPEVLNVPSKNTDKYTSAQNQKGFVNTNFMKYCYIYS